MSRMFEQISRDLLRDLEHIALGVLALGLLFNFLWKTAALGGRGEGMLSGDVSSETKPDRGKVRSDLMAPIDLFMAVIILALYYLLFFSSGGANSASSEPAEPVVPGKTGVIIQLMLMIFLVSFALSTIFIGGQRSAKTIFGLDRLTFPRCLLWVVGGAVVCGGLVMLFHVLLLKYWLLPTFGEMAVQNVVETLLRVEDPVVKSLLIVNACLVAPLAEEVLFRGYIYAVVKRYAGPVFSIVVVGLLFAVVHLNLAALWPLWLFAILLTLAYEFSGSLWVPVGIHALFNTFNVVLMFLGPDVSL